MGIHLKIDTIDGDSIADTYEKQIDCVSWNWGASNNSDSQRGSGLSQTTSQVQSMNVACYMGLASVKLMVAAMTGKHMGTIVLHCTKQLGDGKKTMEWLTITMNDAMITSCGQGGSEGDMGMDQISISFKEVQMQYFKQTDKGAKENGPDNTFNTATGVLVK